MSAVAATMGGTMGTAGEPWTIAGNLDAQAYETHTGLVVLLGDKAYKAKKPVRTDFLDFSTRKNRETACDREVALNRRLSPNSYLGVGHFVDPLTGDSEPVIVMRRYADDTRLSTMIRAGHHVHDHLETIAAMLAGFHRDAARGAAIDECADIGAVSGRWQENLDELAHHADTVPGETIHEVRRLVAQFLAGREALFSRRIADRRVVDGHADLLTDDIFCPPGEVAILDCLEFDDTLRYVDAIDDAAFLAMDLEFLGREDLGEFFLDSYRRYAGDDAPKALRDFYIAYRAVVRAKVDCIRVAQGHADAGADARRHLDIALEHLKAGTVQLVIVGGGPGTGKSTLAKALAEQLGAQVISTDDVRRQMQDTGAITGAVGVLDSGLYTPENVLAVYDEVLRRADLLLRAGTSVILDGTWRDPGHRERARQVAGRTNSPVTEFTCSLPLEDAATRIAHRTVTTSDATPEIAAAIAAASTQPGTTFAGHLIDTSRPLADSVAEAQQICCLAI